MRDVLAHRFWWVLLSGWLSLLGLSASAQEVKQIGLPDSLKVDRQKVIRMKPMQPDLSVARMPLEVPFQSPIERFELRKPIMEIDFDRPALDLKLQGYHLGLPIDALPTTALSTAYARAMSVELELSNAIDVTTSFQVAHHRAPFSPLTTTDFSSSLGLMYQPVEWLRLSPSLRAGTFLGSRFGEVSIGAEMALAERLKLDLSGGFAYGQSMMSPLMSHNAMYGNLRLHYTTESGVFFYGEGFAGRQEVFNRLYQSGLPAPYYSVGFGGGVGYIIPGAGPVSAGIYAVRDPVTGAYQPVVGLNLVGGLIYLIKRVVEAIEDN